MFITRAGALPNLSLEDYLRGGYLLAAGGIIVASSIPELSVRFLKYGKTAADTAGPRRCTSTTPTINTSNEKEKALPRNSVTTILDFLTTLRVPHAYFSHFYFVSLACSVFWAWQIFAGGTALRYLLCVGLGEVCVKEHDGRGGESGGNGLGSGGAGRSMSWEQIWLVWACIAAQGARRAWEQVYTMIPSNRRGPVSDAQANAGNTSQMWIAHYLVGLLFYLFLGLSALVEGRDTLLQHQRHQHQYHNRQFSRTFSESLPRIHLPPPSLCTTLTLPVFILASSLQHDAHAYLSSLPKYTLPPQDVHILFAYCLCPHYLCEIIIYVTLTFMAAPDGHIINHTMATVAFFVTVNLAISARSSGKCYRGREEFLGAQM